MVEPVHEMMYDIKCSMNISSALMKKGYTLFFLDVNMTATQPITCTSLVHFNYFISSLLFRSWQISGGCDGGMHGA